MYGTFYVESKQSVSLSVLSNLSVENKSKITPQDTCFYPTIFVYFVRHSPQHTPNDIHGLLFYRQMSSQEAE